jgi:hypothetical protein
MPIEMNSLCSTPNYFFSESKDLTEFFGAVTRHRKKSAKGKTAPALAFSLHRRSSNTQGIMRANRIRFSTMFPIATSDKKFFADAKRNDTPLEITAYD